MAQDNDIRIIIIDDNPSIHQDFIKILAPKRVRNSLDDLDDELFGDGHNSEEIPLPTFVIDTALQGEEGVKCVKEAIEEGKPYALAFIDIRMPPGIDGIETIKQISKITQDIQFVICTAFSDYSWEETIKQLGAMDNLLILKKPFDMTAVRQLAWALGKKWQLTLDARSHTEALEQNIRERTSSLQESLSLKRATLESSTDGILVVNKVGEIIDYNNQYIEMWGTNQPLTEHTKFKDVLQHMSNQLETPSEFLDDINELTKDLEKVITKVFRLKDGHIFELYSQPQKMEGASIGRVYSFRDVTKRISLESALEYQATHDSLTGLPNRALLVDRIRQSIASAKRHKHMVGILFFDLDRFKLVNDSLGHNAGDELLIDVGRRLQSIVREQDTIARLGGDEFVLVVDDVKNEQAIENVANKLLSIFKEPFKIMGRNLYITASVGVSFHKGGDSTIEDLLRDADIAMYQAKKAGAGQFKYHSKNFTQEASVRLEKEEDLKSAFANNEFMLYYQPQYNTATKTMDSVEVLLRWQHPTKGIILPLEFIPLAEEIGFIIPLGEWVMRTACAQNKKWQEQGLTPIRVAVNVASQQIKHENFVSLVSQILEETGLEPKYLELEVTENVIVSHPDILKTLNELKDIGVQISLDDFGTGNSGLNYLKKVHLDRLKIDKSFVQNIGMEASDEVIIRAIIAVAQGLHYDVIAEGVETTDQISFLNQENCDNVQGYYFGKPMPVSDIENIFVKNLQDSTPLKKRKL